MIGLHKVLVVLENELDLSIRNCAVADESDNRLWDRHLARVWVRFWGMYQSESLFLTLLRRLSTSMISSVSNPTDTAAYNEYAVSLYS